MNLIEGIEIAYFRSIYKENFSDLSDLNIFFGRNDSGKSNFLRALNLFFEGQTNPGMPFNFDRDFNHARLSEVEASAGARKFVYIKIHFRSPRSWRNSLGKSFWVKKQWSVNNQDQPGFETSVDQQKQHYVTRFLNKIKFHYVPAIKDRTIFERLLSRLYSVLSSQKEFNQSLNSFSKELKAKTDELSKGLLGSLGVNSIISPPTDLTDLFKSLDFETKGPHGDSYSLTLQRGDGVQVRHIPEILAFLSDRGPEDFHIWGFEEPENSLELASAIAEAQRFVDFSKNSNKQIFLTSHSPAFFRVSDSSARRYFVSKKSHPIASKECSDVKLIKGLDGESLPADLMGETPHLAIISSYLDEATKKINFLEDQSKILTSKINEASTPILFVEGSNDVKLIRHAWNYFVGAEHKLRVESCFGTSKMESLARNGSVLKMLAPGVEIFVLVDNDSAGRNVMNDGRIPPEGGKWVQHNSNKSWWCRTPASIEFIEEMRLYSIAPSYWPCMMENAFSRSVRLRAMKDGAYDLSDNPYVDILNPENYQKILSIIHADPAKKIYFFEPSTDSKDKFTDWLIDESAIDDSVLDPLKPILLEIYGKLGVN